MSQKGFSLIELMVTLAVLAVLLSLAAPSFAQLIRTNRAAAEINSLTGMVNFARRESAQRAQSIYLRGPAADGTWGVWKSGDDPTKVNPLRTFPAISSFTIEPAGAQSIVFDSRGQLAGNHQAKVELTFKPKDTSLDCATYSRKVFVELSGSVSVRRSDCQ